MGGAGGVVDVCAFGGVLAEAGDDLGQLLDTKGRGAGVVLPRCVPERPGLAGGVEVGGPPGRSRSRAGSPCGKSGSSAPGADLVVGDLVGEQDVDLGGFGGGVTKPAVDGLNGHTGVDEFDGRAEVFHRDTTTTVDTAIRVCEPYEGALRELAAAPSQRPISLRITASSSLCAARRESAISPNPTLWRMVVVLSTLPSSRTA